MSTARQVQLVGVSIDSMDVCTSRSVGVRSLWVVFLCMGDPVVNLSQVLEFADSSRVCGKREVFSNTYVGLGCLCAEMERERAVGMRRQCQFITPMLSFLSSGKSPSFFCDFSERI